MSQTSQKQRLCSSTATNSSVRYSNCSVCSSFRWACTHFCWFKQPPFKHQLSLVLHSDHELLCLQLIRSAVYFIFMGRRKTPFYDFGCIKTHNLKQEERQNGSTDTFPPFIFALLKTILNIWRPCQKPRRCLFELNESLKSLLNTGNLDISKNKKESEQIQALPGMKDSSWTPSLVDRWGS